MKYFNADDLSTYVYKDIEDTQRRGRVELTTYKIRGKEKREYVVSFRDGGAARTVIATNNKRIAVKTFNNYTPPPSVYGKSSLRRKQDQKAQEKRLPLS